MNKTWIITQREFTSRVKKKTFLLTTILLPILFLGFYFAILYFSIKGGDTVNIIVADKANVFKGNLKSDGDLIFTFNNESTQQQLEDAVRNKKYTASLYVPENFQIATDSLNIKTSKSIGLISKERLEKRINNQLKEMKLLSLVSKSQLDSAQKEANIGIDRLDGEGKQDKSGIAYIIGYIAGFLIYIVLFIYGSMVMRGVMEEKVNRIAEVIVSSVKPFQLMMGKILGIGAVGLVQFLIWIVLGVVLSSLIPLLMPGQDPSAAMQQMPGGAAPAMPKEGMGALFAQLNSLNIPLLVGCFMFYFLGGYLLYSSLFAAVGSAVNEDPQDAQSLMLPITMPIIFAIIIMTKAVNDPNGSLAVFGSLFPLTSPVVMIARVAHGVPDGVTSTELILSMVLLVLGFLCTTWLAAKIYRTGILLYGKKVTWKEMWKWAVRKN